MLMAVPLEKHGREFPKSFDISQNAVSSVVVRCIYLVVQLAKRGLAHWLILKR